MHHTIVFLDREKVGAGLRKQHFRHFYQQYAVDCHKGKTRQRKLIFSALGTDG
jgi:hypothetical protein